MNSGDLRVRALELWNVLKQPSTDDARCIVMLENALRNVARELADEEHGKRVKAEKELAELRAKLDMAPVASVAHPVSELAL